MGRTSRSSAPAETLIVPALSERSVDCAILIRIDSAKLFATYNGHNGAFYLSRARLAYDHRRVDFSSAQRHLKVTQKGTSISSLTGLRFLAALSVFWSHMLPAVVPFANPPSWYQALHNTAAEGMMTFFVLSGFVIHYNYSPIIIADKVGGVYRFLCARVARVFPLYLFLLAYTFLFQCCYSQLSATAVRAWPYYVALVQSWLYWPMGKYGLIYEAGGAIPIAWSVSTEWLFYLAYPFLLVALTRMRSVRAKVLTAVISGMVTCIAVAFVGFHSQQLNQFADTHFGQTSAAACRHQYDFVRWLVYFSPYMRISEFILGCLCASFYMQFERRPVSQRESRIGFMVLIATIIALAGAHYAIFSSQYWPGLWPNLLTFHMAYGFAPFIAIIIFCLARYDNVISRALSWWPLVLCGEATYSLYLLHMFVVQSMRWEAAPVTSFAVGVGDFLRFGIATMMGIGLSLVSWRTIEEPARRWLRSKLTLSHLKISRQPAMQAREFERVG